MTFSHANRVTGDGPVSDLPSSVRQVAMTAQGGPEVLRLEEVATPAVSARQVLIATEAAGVAFNDVTTRKGLNPGRPPRVLGFDVVGTVVGLGAGVRDLQPGQRVGALVGSGGYASHVVADRRVVVPMPADLDAAEADALLLNYTVADLMLHDVARVRPGQRVLVHSAAGGVGSALVQLARLEGVDVVGIAGASRRAFVEAAGATWVPSIGDASWTFDAVFDSVGGPSIKESRARVRRGGRVVVFGFSFVASAGYSRVGGLLRSALALLRARLTPGPRTSMFLIESVMRRRPERLGEVVAELAPLVRDRRVVPAVTRLPLEQAAEAHRRLEGRTVEGKVVLVVGPHPQQG